MQYPNPRNDPSFKPDHKLVKTKKKLDALEGKTAFEKYQLLFKYLGYETYLIRVSKDNPVEQLIVSIPPSEVIEDEIPDEEYLKHHTVIQMMYVNDLVDTVSPDELKKTDDDPFTLQFFSILPIKFNPDKYWKLNALLLVLNRILPIGAMGLSGTKEIYYRYTLMAESRSVSNQVVVEILSVIDSFLKKYRRKITNYVEDKETLEQITKQVKEGSIAKW